MRLCLSCDRVYTACPSNSRSQRCSFYPSRVSYRSDAVLVSHSCAWHESWSAHLVEVTLSLRTDRCSQALLHAFHQEILAVTNCTLERHTLHHPVVLVCLDYWTSLPLSLLRWTRLVAPVIRDPLQIVRHFYLLHRSEICSFWLVMASYAYDLSVAISSWQNQ